MRIYLNKFGTTLVFRQNGKEAFAVFQPTLKDLKDDDKLELDFEGVDTLSPSWGDEFLSPLLQIYGNRLVLLNTKNLSVEATLELLESVGDKKFNIVS
jgi:hypothetical protein